MDTGQTIILLSWADVFKIVAGFLTSALLLWLGLLAKDQYRKKTLKRSVWNIFKHQTSLDSWINALNGMCQSAKEGNAYAISFDISLPLSSLVSELASIDPLKSDIYYDLLGKEEVVRQGLSKLNLLQMELVKRRTEESQWKHENVSIRSMIQGQCSALREDVVAMYESQLVLMRYIEIKRDDAVCPIDNLEKSLDRVKKPEQ